MLSNRRFGWRAGALALAAAAFAGCGTKTALTPHSAPAPIQATTTIPPTVATDPPTTAAPQPTSTTSTTITTAPTSHKTEFPAVVNEAMETFKPEVGLEAPVSLPETKNAVSAQTSDLGGSDSVTLIATSTTLPVNDPTLDYSPSTDLGTFTSSPTADLAAAEQFMTTDATNSLATCSGATTTIHVLAVPATECATVQGEAVTWTVGNWKIQVLSTSGAAPTDAAAQLQQWIASNDLPAASSGIVSAVEPGSSSVSWSQGDDVYQTRSPQGVNAAAELASTMRPWTS